MNLDELRTVQSKERSKDSLQHLRESFYADVADYIADLRERRDRRAEQADDPFADPEVRRLTDEIETAEEVVEGIYERRVGKVVKRASLAAMGVASDAEGLTAEERELYESLVDRIETNKQSVLDVLAGEESSPEVDPATSGDGASAPGAVGAADTAAGTDVSAADVMGGDAAGTGTAGGASPADATDSPGASDSAAADVTGALDAADATDATDGADDRPSAEAAAVAGTESPTDAGSASGAADAVESAGAAESADAATDEARDDPLAGLDERTTVRVTDDVGEIFGVDERTYDLEREDVVTLPAANADPLVEQGAAEKLE